MIHSTQGGAFVESSRVSDILSEAYERLSTLKFERALLVRELVIDEALSVISGIVADVNFGAISQQDQLLAIGEFAEQVLWSFQFPQAEEPMPYSSNLEALRYTLHQFRLLMLTT